MLSRTTSDRAVLTTVTAIVSAALSRVVLDDLPRNRVQSFAFRHAVGSSCGSSSRAVEDYVVHEVQGSRPSGRYDGG